MEREASGALPVEGPLHGYRGDSEATTEFRPLALTVAITREAGARGGTIGRRVGKKLGWQVFDQELLEDVVQDAAVQQGVTDGLDEVAALWVEEQVQRLDLGASAANIARLSLALGAKGKVVLIGRGAGFLLPRNSTLHIRLVAPLEDRVAYLSQLQRLTLEEARQQIRARDARRTEFLTHHLRQHPGQIHAYDMVLNTSCLGEELSAELIAHAVGAKQAAIEEVK